MPLFHDSNTMHHVCRAKFRTENVQQILSFKSCLYSSTADSSAPWCRSWVSFLQIWPRALKCYSDCLTLNIICIRSNEHTRTIFMRKSVKLGYIFGFKMSPRAPYHMIANWIHVTQFKHHCKLHLLFFEEWLDYHFSSSNLNSATNSLLASEEIVSNLQKLLCSWQKWHAWGEAISRISKGTSALLPTMFDWHPSFFLLLPQPSAWRKFSLHTLLCLTLISQGQYHSPHASKKNR